MGIPKGWEITRDSRGIARGISHLCEPSLEEDQQQLTEPVVGVVEAYLERVSDVYEFTPELLAGCSTPLAPSLDTSEGSRLRLAETKESRGCSILTFQQIHHGLPVWEAGVVVRTAGPNNRVTSSSQSLHRDVEVDCQGAEFEPDSEATEKRLHEVTEQSGLKLEKIHRMSRLIYRFDPEARQPEEHEADSGGFPQTVELPRIVDNRGQDDLRPGAHYLVTEVLFATSGPSINWRVFLEARSGAVLYYRPFVSGATGLVFANDPISSSGNSQLDPNADGALLDDYRSEVVLERLNFPPAPTPVSLSGDYVELVDSVSPGVAPPTETGGAAAEFEYGSTTDEFSAVNAYYHLDQLYEFVASLGFDIPTYFDGASFPVPVDHRGEFGGVNAHAWGNALGDAIGNYTFGLADGASTVGIAADARVVAHEFGHGVLWDHLHSPNLGFCHGIGDSLAAVLYDPDSTAPDRFRTFPFNNLVLRRHDRAVESGWGFGGTRDVGGYASTEILSTVMFRLYRFPGRRPRRTERTPVHQSLRRLSDATSGSPRRSHCSQYCGRFFHGDSGGRHRHSRPRRLRWWMGAQGRTLVLREADALRWSTASGRRINRRRSRR